MRHFYRSHMVPAEVVEQADRFFPAIDLQPVASGGRTRTFSGPLGTVTVTARSEGGHYTFVEVDTDQMGESRLDKNVKRFFVQIHKTDDPAHMLEASY